MASRIARLVPREVVLGIMLGLGMSFMLEGARMMSANWPIACAAFLVAILLRNSRTFPAMFVLLLGGFGYSIATEATLLEQLGRISIELRLPQLALPALSLNDLLLGAIYLALPQVPLTLGNAIIGVKEENNRLFPDRAVTVKGVAISTGVMNLFGSAVGGVPMCHGAGGMAAHTSFGARTGGSSIILGVLLIILALAFSGSLELLLRAFPGAVLGVILFLAGVLLAAGNMPSQASKQQAFILAATAGMAIWNVAAAFIAGMVLSHLAKRGHLDA
jgi:MFS superfamily sulfate permease-like transporter